MIIRSDTPDLTIAPCVDVSVIIPTYNRAFTIMSTLNSVLTQEGVHLEVIVVDDGSTDETKELLERQDDPRIRYFRFNESQGAQIARNYGVRQAKAELITFLDSDDTFLPNSLYKRVEYFEDNPASECSYSNYEVRFVGRKGNYIKHATFSPDHSEGKYENMLKTLALAPTSVLMARKKIFEGIGGMDIRLPSSQDDDIYLRFSKRGGLYCIPIEAMSFCMHDQSRVSSNLKKVALGWSMLINKYREDIVYYLGNRALAKHLISNSADYFLAYEYKSGKEKYNDAKSYVKYPYWIWLFLLFKLSTKLARHLRNKLLGIF